jgi:MFS family permease
VKEPAVDQGKQIFGLQLRLLPFLGRIGARSGRRRRRLAGIFGFTVAPLLRCAGLRALCWGCLHPPSDGCLHSHPIGGYSCDKLRRHVV